MLYTESMGSVYSGPTGVVSARLPVELIAWLDADRETRGGAKRTRSQYLQDFLEAVRAADAARAPRPHPKPQKK